MSLALRAIMIDAARLQERDEHYRKLIRFAAKWGANAIVFRVADDQGTAMRFRCLPKARRKNQYSKKAMAALAQYARKHGIQLIPEIETLGHSKYITEHPGYEDLSEGEDKNFTGLCVSRPKTYKILKSLIEETAEVFDSDLIHLGCDESVLGQCPRCAKKLQKESKHTLYARHVMRLRRIAASCGKRIIIWGDHLTDLWGNGRINDPKAVDMLPKDIVVANWDYRHTVTDVSTDELTRAGFEVLTCPALHWCRAAVFPSKLEIQNVKRFVKQAHSYSGQGATGSIITIWCPYRFIPDTMWHSMALSCRLMSQPKFNRRTFEAEFAQTFYGISEHEDLAQAYEHFYKSGLGLDKEFHAMFFASAEDLAEAAKLPRRRISYLREHATEAKRRFEAALEKGTKHRTELRACILGTDIVLEGCRRSQIARDLTRNADRLRHKEMAGLAHSLAQRAAHYWDRARFADDEKKWAPPEREKLKAYLVAQLSASANYSKEQAT